MHILLGVGLLVASGLASPVQFRSHDTCLQALFDFALEAAPFCSIYTPGRSPNKLPGWLTACSNQPSKISSACSCFKTSTSSAKKTSTTPVKTISSSSSTKETSSSYVTSGSSTVASTFTSSSLTSYTMTPTNSFSSSTSSSTFSTSSSTSSSVEYTTTTSSFISSVVDSSTSTIFTTSETSSSVISSTLSTEVSSASSTFSSTESSTSIEATTSSEIPTSSSTITSTTSSIPSSTSSASSSVRTAPPAGAIVVDATGAFVGSYPKVQLGVNALNATTTTPQYLFIYPGSYYEQVYIPQLKSNLTVQGYTTDATSYVQNAATITYNLALLNTTSDDLTATVRQWNTNTKFYNLNIANTFGHVSTNGQNLAISAHTGRQGYYGMQFLGYQDTILSNTGSQLYAKSLITGAVDFIFGQTATAWFDGVDIRTIAAGAITASGRSSASNPSWYVINNSTVDGIDSTIAAATSFLGRPWQSFARVVFQNTYLGAIIAPAGWRVWSTAVNGSTNIGNVTFAEWNNYGPGSILQEGPRANFSFQLDSPIAIETVLGNAWKDEWWVDLNYMSY